MESGGTVVLDGSEGEGGGQILRTALSLSLITGRALHIENVRANRKPAGLRPQHLACVRGAVAVSGARVEGAQVGGSELWFEPGPVKPGQYLLEVGTAGSTPLLFQCLYFPLALGGGGELTLRGGTHVAHSPSYHYLVRVWLPAMRRFGFDATLSLRYAGFYPEGTGELRAKIPPSLGSRQRVDLRARGMLYEVGVTSMVANLPFEIAERQAKAASSALRERGIAAEVEKVPLPSLGSTGTMVFIRAEFEHSVAGFSALGEKGKRAEEVGREAAAELARFMESAGAIDEHLGDQILVPAALLAAGKLGEPAPSRYRPAKISAHLTTNARVLERFLPIVVVVESGEVMVLPKSAVKAG
ncbi:MAG: RNA 3'-terminal phosphate cyclase [Myxococcota bacterium]